MFNDFNFWVLQLEKAAALPQAIKSIYSFHSFDLNKSIRSTQREYSSSPLKRSIVKRIFVFKR